MKATYAIIAVSLFLVSCSQSNTNSLHALKEKSDGIIVKAELADIQAIESSYDIKAEVISHEASLYLVKGVSQKEVQDLGIQAKTFNNTFIDVPRKHPMPKALQIFATDDMAIAPDSPTQPDDTPSQPKLDLECGLSSQNIPLAVSKLNVSRNSYIDISTNVSASSLSLSANALQLLKSTNPTVMGAKKLIEEQLADVVCTAETPEPLLGMCIPSAKLSSIVEAQWNALIRYSIKSGSLQLAKDNLTLRWFVEDPVGEAKELSGEIVTFKPNRVGTHYLHLIVQDIHNSNCSIDSTPIYVTANPALIEMPTQKPILRPGAENIFHQLGKTENIKARELSTGKGVVIAIIDTGVNYNHSALRPNIFINKEEIPGNGVDEDENGFVDDVFGYDFVNNDAFPYDDDNHGTHVAGIAAATDVGLAPDATILPIKVIPASTAQILKGMAYAVAMKADVVNMSLRMYANSPEDFAMFFISNPFEEIIKSGQKTNTVFTLGSGNESISIDKAAIMPAASEQANAVTIAAVDDMDQMTSYSNFGLKQVDIAAYGGTREKPIFASSLYPDKGHLLGLTGTSMATPVVSGIVAQIKEIVPDASAEEVIEILKQSSVKQATLEDKIAFGSIAHSLRAVELALESQKTIASRP